MEKTLSLNKLRILSGSMLKLLAVISMLIDHTALILSPVIGGLLVPFEICGHEFTWYYIMRKFGRIAFPIFCFLITEGFLHTRNKQRYALRLLLFALLSELPYNLMVGNALFHTAAQNVYFTLFLGLLMIYAYETVTGESEKFALMACVCVAAKVLSASYGLPGAILVFLIYLLREKPAAQAIASYPLLSGKLFAFAAFVPINMYNGQRGFIKTPILQHLFYIFYPAHILLLVLIRYLLKQ